MKILILGSGQVGSTVAQNLASMPNNDVTIIDIDETALHNLGSKLDVQTLHGNAASPMVLERAGASLGPAGRLPWKLACIGAMFVFTCYGWLLFRATSFDQVASMSAALMTPLDRLPVDALVRIGWLTLPLFVVQLIQFNTGMLEFQRTRWLPRPVMAIAYAAMLYAVLFLGGEPQAFVYFQF